MTQVNACAIQDVSSAEVRAVAASIAKPVRFATETEEQAKLRRLTEYQRAGELLTQLAAHNAGLEVQLAAARKLLSEDQALLGQRATRILLLEDMLRRCLAVWQDSPTWGNLDLLVEAQAMLDEATA